jgi:sigma-E factor negative regulatory protein RseC
MITENGIVSNANASTAWIKTIRASSCKSCSSRDNCETAQNKQEMIVTVKNTLAVEKGDHVVIGLEAKSLITLSFLLYVFPIILLIIGAVIGDSLAPVFDMSPSLAAMAIGFLLFAVSFLFIRRKSNQLSKKNEYKPFLVRKKTVIISGNCSMI